MGTACRELCHVHRLVFCGDPLRCCKPFAESSGAQRFACVIKLLRPGADKDVDRKLKLRHLWAAVINTHIQMHLNFLRVKPQEKKKCHFHLCSGHTGGPRDQGLGIFLCTVMQKLGLRLCDQAEMNDHVSPGAGSLESPLFFSRPESIQWTGN